MKTQKLIPFAALLSGLLIPAAPVLGNGNSNNSHGDWDGDWNHHHSDYGRARTLIVSPSHLEGWVFFSNGAPEGNIQFVTGPAIAPLGSGSLSLGVTDTLQRVVLATGAFAGTRLEDLTALSYRTFRSSPATGTLAPTLQLDIDYDLNDTTTTAQGQLIFVPSATANSWQLWDALTGTWYMNGTPIKANVAGAQTFPLATPGTFTQILAQFPNAGIRRPFGNISFAAGGPGGAFTGAVDALTVGVEGERTYTFDFEPDTDGDTVPDSEDNCPNSNFQPKVDVGMGDTTVINTVDDNGCTLQDLVREAELNATSHSKYVKAINKLADALRKSGTITRIQVKELKADASASTIGN